MFSRQTVRGNVCFLIANNDKKTLSLYYTAYSILAKDFLAPKPLRSVWFALR